VHLVVETPSKLSDEQRELLTRFAALRGEEAAEPRVLPREDSGLFSRLKDAFGGR
jgi:molecular chaperone DnaJ